MKPTEKSSSVTISLKSVAFAGTVLLGLPKAFEPLVQGRAVQSGKLRRQRHKRKNRPSRVALIRMGPAFQQTLLRDVPARNETFEFKHGVPHSAGEGVI